MAYEKRLCVLKQIKRGFSADGGALSGAVYAERLGGQLTLTPRIMGIAPVREGRYALAVRVGEETYCLELRGNEPLRIPAAPSLKEGFAALVCFVRSAGEPEPVAYGRCGNAPSSYTRLLAVFQTGNAGKKKKPFMPPMPLSPFEQPVPVNPQAPRAPTPALPGEKEDDGPFRDSVAAKYDDDAIAESDYFRRQVPQGDADEGVAVYGEEQAEAAENGRGACGDVQDGAVRPFRLGRGGLTYYYSVREKLDAALKKYPRDTRLNGVFPHSEWVKTENALLGVIYAEGIPRYLCVAAEAAEQPPSEMRGNGVFVPSSEFGDDEGFYVVFQDADTGEYVKILNS